MSKILISIVGPTAIGKTALSIKLANHFKTEIISADSRQFFKEMQIGTAVPSPNELNSAKHHLIHHKSITDDYSVGAFEKEALDRIEQVHKKHQVAIMVGGSGLYVDAVVRGLDDFPKVDKSIRENLNKHLETKGLISLQKELKKIDPVSYNKIAIDNPHRVIRALEIGIGTGKPYASFLIKEKKERPFKTLTIGLVANRQTIYDRINKRVDLMIEAGLLAEVKKLVPHKNLNALNTVGYKELIQYFDGLWSLEFAVSEIKKNTRRFAKRQLTWFKKNDTTKWFDYLTDLETMLEAIHIEIDETH